METQELVLTTKTQIKLKTQKRQATYYHSMHCPLPARHVSPNHSDDYEDITIYFESDSNSSPGLHAAGCATKLDADLKHTKSRVPTWVGFALWVFLLMEVSKIVSLMLSIAWHLIVILCLYWAVRRSCSTTGGI
jgi:hypothetical protein